MSGKKTISNTTPAIGAIQIQQSTYGTVIPIVWGRTRLAGNLIWYGDFKAVPHTTTTQSGGKGGSAPSQSTTTYTYTASVAMALCEGPVVDILTTWRGKNIFQGQTYNGAQAQETDLFTYPASGSTITVANTSGWKNVSVQMQVKSGYADDFTYNRTNSWITLVPGSDYTCSAGVYTFTNAAQNQGANLRITYTYASNNTGSSCLAQIGLELHNGTPGQAPWSYLTSKHPDQALGYSGVAYVAGANYSLDSGASVENHAFEVQTGLSISSSVPDADPSKIVQDALSNPLYGVRFGLEKLAPLSDYSNACLAQGIVLSPALTEQMSAAAFLDSMSQLTNVGIVWSGGLLKFIPYTDTPITGNGVTFTPNTAPIYDLTDDDFQPVDDEGPIKVTRGAVSDSFNSVKLEFFDRSNDYNLAIMEQADQADIQENGARPMSVITAHWITDANVAKVVATLILQRSLFVRNTYEFKLGWTKIGLEPMDLVTLTDANLGLNKQPVRILTIEEDDTGYLSVTAEDFPKGSASATLYPTGTSNSYTPNFNEDPGSIVGPLIFEGPAALATLQGGLEVWLAAGGLSDTYGGCEVWVSLTGSNYQRAAVLNGSSRFGVTTSVMPTVAPGTVTSDTLGVTLSAGGQLLAGTVDDMTALTTLCYVDGEYFSYQNSQLTGVSAYTIGNQMVRGAYLSRSQNTHAQGIPFIRCDDAIAKVPLTPDYIGKTLHIKVLPFNRYGGALGSLASATEYLYTVTGWQANLPPIAPTNLTTEGPFTISTAKFKWDKIGNAATYNVQIWAGSPLAKVREVNVGNALRFDYSASDAKSDGGPWRALTIKVQGIHANGAAGAFSTLAVTNPQVGALSGVSVTSGAMSVIAACARPADPDFAGIQVWMSATSGFTPSAATLVYDGPNTSVILNRLADGSVLANGTTYYVVMAGYDSFDKAGMAMSAQAAVTISAATVQTGMAYLYQWSPVLPAAPNGTSTYTWATGVNSAYSGSDSWSVATPGNPGTPGVKLYVASVPLSVSAGTPTTTVNYSGANVAAWSQNGMSGVQSGVARVYKWAATIPGAPAGGATYTWSDGTFGSAPTGWSLTPGSSPVGGYTLWEAKVPVTDSASSTSTAFSWTGATISAVGYAGTNGTNGTNGSNGYNGSSGAPGNSYVTAYCASSTGATSTAPAATFGQTSVPATNDGGIAGAWQRTVPSLSTGQYLYQSDGIYNPSTNVVTWSIPYWSSLKVGNLSAVAVNTGDINVNGSAAVAAGGSVSSGQTGFNTGTGFWLAGGGTPQFSIGNSSGPRMTWDGSTLNVVNATVSNPTLDGFSAAIGGYASGSYPNGSYGYGTLTAYPSGGKAPYSYTWSLSPFTTGNGGGMKISGASSQSATFSGAGTNTTLDYDVFCIVTDANGRTVTLNVEVTVTHGTPT